MSHGHTITRPWSDQGLRLTFSGIDFAFFIISFGGSLCAGCFLFSQMLSFVVLMFPVSSKFRSSYPRAARVGTVTWKSIARALIICRTPFSCTPCSRNIHVARPGCPKKSRAQDSIIVSSRIRNHYMYQPTTEPSGQRTRQSLGLPEKKQSVGDCSDLYHESNPSL